MSRDHKDSGSPAAQPISDSRQIRSIVRTLPSEEELVAKCLELGLVMRRAPTYDITHPAITLFPSVIQADVMRELYAKQTLWNEAIDRTARNFTFVRDALHETAASDVAFTGKLLDMMQRVYLQPPVLPESAEVAIDHPVYQPRMLGIFRTDYMRAMDGVATPVDGQPRPAETAAQWKNVEFNTVSCSFAALSTLVGQFHNYLQKYRNVLLRGKSEGGGGGGGGTSAQAAEQPSVVEPGAVEESISLDEIPDALAGAAEAWKASVPLRDFIESYREASRKRAAEADPETTKVLAGLAGEHADRDEIPIQPVVLVVIQEDERNTGDQYKLLFTLLEKHGVVSIRRTMAQLHDSMELVYFNGYKDSASPAPDSKYQHPPFAVVERKYVASVVYFRSTYVPADFPTQAIWESRERLERCNAIKCPSLPHHLLTFKKMQQLLSLVPTVLVPIAFNGDEEKAKSLAMHFMEQYSLNKDDLREEGGGGGSGGGAAGAKPLHDDDDPEVHIRAAIDDPHEYVLKPQLEGGGNLIAGDEMKELLQANMREGDPYYAKIRKEYILMRKIRYEKKDGLLFRQGQMFFFDKNVCSELGIFGCILSDGTEATYHPDNTNVSADGTLRSAKPNTANPSHVFNRCGGYNMRTKPADVEDGGVMAGVACLDNVRLR